MISAREVLGAIENAVAKLRGDEDRLERALRLASEEGARLRLERAEALRALARVRLDTLEREGVVGELDLAERRAVELLSAWRAGLERLDERRRETEARESEARAARDRAAAAFEHAVAAVATLRDEAIPLIRASAEWRDLKTRADEAVKVSEEANRKAVQAEIDRKEKAKPYEADPLFTYLWERRFGTAAYRASPLVRFLDRKVASLIRYDAARADYAMLTEIPVRLREHAARCEAQIDAAADALAAFERETLLREGLSEREAAVVSAKSALDAAETALADASEKLAAIEGEREKASARGAQFAQAVDVLAEADGRASIKALRAEAERTRTAEDDAIVARLEQIDTRIGALDREAQDLRDAIRKAAERRAEVERERNTFHRRGYDHPQGGFENGASLAETLAKIAAGALAGAKLDQILRDNWRTPPDPWGMPRRRDNGFGTPPGPPPGGPWSGNDGFRTGGTMGGDDKGGGFRTGGSF